MFDDALKSLARQSLQDYEIIVVDDASTDERSRTRLVALQAHDIRVRIIRHQVNSGLSASRNTGFRHARSQYVFILDTDDMLEPTCLEKSYLFLTTQPAAGFVKGYTVGEITDILFTITCTHAFWCRVREDAVCVEEGLHRQEGVPQAQHRICGQHDTQSDLGGCWWL